MKSRRKAREVALQALYQCDTLEDWSHDMVELYFSVYRTEAKDTEGNSTAAENYQFSRSLIYGVAEFLDFIDSQISVASTHWSLARMSRVDRNILRISTYEMGFLPEIPMRVSINEAIEIAKEYGTDDSPMFVNGVLDNLAHTFEANPETIKRALDTQRKRLAANG
jgi:transcription antitermination protein NusB